MSPDQNFLPRLADEKVPAGISVSMAPVPWAAQPQLQGALKGGHVDSLRRLKQQLWEFTQLKATSFLHSHISKEPHTAVVSSIHHSRQH